jgi:hypothetical protein
VKVAPARRYEPTSCGALRAPLRTPSGCLETAHFGPGSTVRCVQHAAFTPQLREERGSFDRLREANLLKPLQEKYQLLSRCNVQESCGGVEQY